MVEPEKSKDGDSPLKDTAAVEGSSSHEAILDTALSSSRLLLRQVALEQNVHREQILQKYSLRKEVQSQLLKYITTTPLGELDLEHAIAQIVEQGNITAAEVPVIIKSIQYKLQQQIPQISRTYAAHPKVTDDWTEEFLDGLSSLLPSRNEATAADALARLKHDDLIEFLEGHLSIEPVNEPDFSNPLTEDLQARILVLELYLIPRQKDKILEYVALCMSCESELTAAAQTKFDLIARLDDQRLASFLTALLSQIPPGHTRYAEHLVRLVTPERLIRTLNDDMIPKVQRGALSSNQPLLCLGLAYLSNFPTHKQIAAIYKIYDNRQSPEVADIIAEQAREKGLDFSQHYLRVCRRRNKPIETRTRALTHLALSRGEAAIENVAKFLKPNTSELLLQAAYLLSTEAVMGQTARNFLKSSIVEKLTQGLQSPELMALLCLGKSKKFPDQHALTAEILREVPLSANILQGLAPRGGLVLPQKVTVTKNLLQCSEPETLMPARALLYGFGVVPILTMMTQGGIAEKNADFLFQYIRKEEGPALRQEIQDGLRYNMAGERELIKKVAQLPNKHFRQNHKEGEKS
ncbi:MAG: hypothetical protein KDD62_05680 [Bdellovibrionales bacterium]|nr:hypothetical protein [Bdellovibrionales bacterium]